MSTRTQNLVVTKEDLEELERFKEDVLYFEEQEGELKKRYPDQWVAIFNKEIVGINRDINYLINSLQSQNIPPHQAVLEFLSTKEKIMILFVG